MTTVSLASVKGAPGVTTLACLVAAAWPEGRRVVIVESDPSGGDLAARFRLSANQGWASFGAASRRLQGTETIRDHVQLLPGGLAVMVRSRPGDRPEDGRTVEALLDSADADADGSWDVLADLGRLLPGERGAGAWLEHSTALAIVLRPDAPSVLRVRERVGAFRRRSAATGLVVVGRGSFRRSEIEQFTELPVLAEVPEVPDAARLAGGTPGRPSRLVRSPLVRSAGRLASVLSADPARWPQAGEASADPPSPARAGGRPGTDEQEPSEGTQAVPHSQDGQRAAGRDRTGVDAPDMGRAGVGRAGVGRAGVGTAHR